MDFIGIILSMLLVCIFGEDTSAMIWAMTAIYSFLQATNYPGGVTWANLHVNMSGRYTFVFSLGMAIGVMTLVPAAGFVFDKGPYNVMYMILAESIANAVVFGCLILDIRRIKRGVRKAPLMHLRTEEENQLCN